MVRTVALACVLGCLAASPVAAQVQNRPSDPPTVTAAGESWFVNRVPILVGGETYFPAGATVFFNGNSMVRSGYLGGVPLYTDTTLEPFSTVLIPAGRGLMRPYERRREGDLAGTTGSRAPSFPVQTVSQDGEQFLMSAGAPTVGSAVDPLGFEPPVESSAADVSVSPGAVGRTADRNAVRYGETRTAARPRSNDGVWVSWNSKVWVSDGRAMSIDEGQFNRIGDHSGTPVLSRRDGPADVIYLASRQGVVAPYRLKP